MNTKRVVLLAFCSVLLISLVAAAEADVALSPSSNRLEQTIRDATNLPALGELIGIVFGIWDIDDLHNLGKNGTAEVIIYLAVWFIFLFVIADILLLFSPFSKGVVWVIALGLVIIAGQLQFIIQTTTWFAGIAAGVGAVAVWSEVILTLVVAFGAAWGSQWAQQLAARRRAARQAAMIDAGAVQAAAVLRGIRRTGAGFTVRP